MVLPNHVYLGTFYDGLPDGPGRYVFDFGVEQHGEYVIKAIKKQTATFEEEIVEVPVWRCEPDLHTIGSSE